MKTAFDYLAEASQEREYSFTDTEVEFIIEAMKTYAQSACEALREKIAKEAKMIVTDSATGKSRNATSKTFLSETTTVDRESILSTPIELK